PETIVINPKRPVGCQWGREAANLDQQVREILSLQKRGCQKTHRSTLAVTGDDDAFFGGQVDLLQSGQRLRPKIQYRARESRFDLPKGLAIDLPRCRPKPEI